MAKTTSYKKYSVDTAQTGAEAIPVALENAHENIQLAALNLDGVYIPSSQATLSYENLSASWEQALDKLAQANANELADVIRDVSTKEAKIDPNLNFLNLEVEELLNVLIDPGNSSLVTISHSDKQGFVTSSERDLAFDVNLQNYGGVESREQDLFIKPVSSVEGQTPTQFYDSKDLKISPTAPEITFSSKNMNGLNSEVFLNTGKPVVLEANIFQLGANFGGIPLGLSVVFQDPAAREGLASSNNGTTITLTSQEGNTLTLYLTDSGGHKFGDIVYTLNNAIHTPPFPSTTVGGQIIFTDKFVYTLSNSQFLSKSNYINIQIIDDHPVATNQSAVQINESNIADIGSNGLTGLNYVVGTLIHPSSDPLPGGLSDNRIGPDGGSVTSIKLIDVDGATDVTANVTYNNTFTNEELDILAAAGYTDITAGKMIQLIDSLGNVYKVDALSSAYIYIQNAAFHHDTPDTIAKQIIEYVFTDVEGQTAKANITFTFEDDKPVLNHHVLDAITEANFPNGTAYDGDASLHTRTGNLVTDSGSTFGADIPGKISLIQYNMVDYTDGGANDGDGIANGIITISDIAGNIITFDISSTEYNYEFNNPYTHTNHQPLTLTYIITIVDADGSTSTGNFSIEVQDDAPIITPPTYAFGNLTEASLPDGSNPNEDALSASATFTALLGADGGTYEVIFNSQSYFDDSDGSSDGVINITDEAGNIFSYVIATGIASFTLNNPYNNTNNVAYNYAYIIKLTDGDGDVAQAQITGSVLDDQPVAVSVSHDAISEADIPDIGSNLSDNGYPRIDGTLIGTLGNTFGADGGYISQIEFEGVVYDQSQSDYLVVQDEAGNIFEINQYTTEYRFILDFPYTNENNQPRILEYTFTFIDGDGSTASAVITITVNDDAPVMNDYEISAVNEAHFPSGSLYEEDASQFQRSGNLLSESGSTFGADLGKISLINYNGQDYVDGGALDADESEDGVITIVDIAGNTVTFNVNSTDYFYNFQNPYTHTNGQPLTLAYLVTLLDSDGSTSTGTVSIVVEDDAPVQNYSESYTLSESDFPNGSSGNTSALVVNSNALTDSGVFIGADIPGHITQVSYENLVYADGNENDADGVEDGFIQIYDISGNLISFNVSSMDYSYEFNNPYVNIDGEPVSLVYTITFADADGSTTSADLTFNVYDDTPVMEAITPAALEESDISEFGTVFLTGNVFDNPNNTYGADLAGYVTAAFNSITNASGVAVETYDPNYVLTAADAEILGDSAYEGFLGTLIVDSLGNSFVLDSVYGNYYYALVSGFENDVAETPVGVNIDITIVDGDGSTATNTLNITINDEVILGEFRARDADLYISVAANGSYFIDFPVTATNNVIIGNIINSYVDKASPSDTVTFLTGAADFHFILDPLASFYTSPMRTTGQFSNQPNWYQTYSNGFFHQDKLFIFVNDQTSPIAPYPSFAAGDFVFGPYSAEIGGDRSYTTSLFYTVQDNRGNVDSGIINFHVTYTIPPVVLDLDGNNQIDMLSHQESGLKLNDIYHDGNQTAVGWVGPNDGFLMFDLNHDQKFTDYNEISFMSYNKDAKSDLEGLMAFDTNKNGMLDIDDQYYSQFGVWQDKNTNAITDEGEFKTLAEMNIISINLTSDNNVHQNAGNIVLGLGEYTTADGKSHVLGDVTLSIPYNDVVVDNKGVNLPELLDTQDPAPVVQQSEANASSPASAPEPVVPVMEIQHITDMIQQQSPDANVV